jgi:BolA protein
VTLEPRIRARLAVLEPQRLELIDESALHHGHAGSRPGGNTHWRMSIVSRKFRGQGTLARHRMIYRALGDLIDNPIHALTIEARAPDDSAAGQSGA